MRGEIVLLVAGLTIAATLPIEEQAYPSTQSELQSIILNANPEENDLRTIGERQSSTTIKTERQATVTEGLQPQDPPQEQSQPQDLPQEQSQPEDPPQEQSQPQDPPHTHTQDTPQEQSQPQGPPQSREQDTLQEESQPQDSNEEPSSPHVSESKTSNEDSNLETEELWDEPQPLLIQAQEDFSYESEKFKDDEITYDMEMETFPDELDDGFVALQPNDEPFSLNLDDDATFTHALKMEAFTQEEDRFLIDPKEPQREYFPYDFNEEALSFEPKIDSSAFEYEELPTEVASAHLQDSFPDNSELVSIGSQMDSFPLNEEPIDSDNEQPSEMQEEPLKADYYGFPNEENQPDYDYEFLVEEDRPQWKEEVFPVHEDGPDGGLYPESDDSAMDLFSWLVPDFLYKDHANYDESSYVTSYYDDVADEDSFVNNADMQIESQTLVEQTTNSEEPYTTEDLDDIINFDNSFPEDEEETGMGETMEPTSYEVTEDAADDVSLADFYIPINDEPAYENSPHEYFEDERLEDEEEGIFTNEEENFLVDDGLFHTNPALRTPVNIENSQPDMKMINNDILFANPSFEDKMSVFFKEDDDNSEEETNYLAEDMPPFIIESQPTYVTDVKNKRTYPSLLAILKKEILGKQLIEPWNDVKSIVIDSTYDLHAENTKNQSMGSDYLSNNFDNDPMSIIVLKNSKKNYGSPIISLIDDNPIIQDEQVPITTRYKNDRNTEPFWLPQRTPQRQFPSVYFSITDELMKREIPAFFDRTDEDVSFLPPLSYRSLKTNGNENQLTLLNKIMDDDYPSDPLPSPKTQSRFRFIGPNTLTSSRDHDTFRTPNFLFRDLLQQMNPSFYDDPYVNNIAKHKYPSYYPRSYNYMTEYRDPYMSSLSPYSAPYELFDEYNYSPLQTHYYATKPRVRSSYSSLNEPSNLFREDTMQGMDYQHPMTNFYGNTDDHRFRFRDSYSTPRFSFPFYQRRQYSYNYPSYRKPTYSHNSFYDIEPLTKNIHARNPIEYY